MGKVRRVWMCTECGAQCARWAGQCAGCHRWNTLQEEVDATSAPRRFEAQCSGAEPVLLQGIEEVHIPRITTGIQEYDRLSGGGIVPGSLTLIGGDPGIGKSTLMLQIAHALGSKGAKVLYICGEESVHQTSLRAKRLGLGGEGIYLLSETNFSMIKAQVDRLNPDVLVVDSIQIVYKGEIGSAPGSVSQVRETTAEFMHLAKGRNLSTFLIGHVTKSGEIAGPRVLEHLVDTVLYFEGDKQCNYRMIRVVKNRFGPTDEIGVFQMKHNGLVEVPNPSQIFLEERMRHGSGAVIVPTLEGTRPILVEVQALVTETGFSNPSRRATGLDPNRLALLIAVLEKRMSYQLYRCDLFVSVAGGLKVNEAAIDLATLIAVVSSMSNQAVDHHTVVMGEVGLGGEVRGITRIESRLKESLQLGFTRALIPQYHLRGIGGDLQGKMEICGVQSVEEAIRWVFDGASRGVERR